MKKVSNLGADFPRQEKKIETCSRDFKIKGTKSKDLHPREEKSAYMFL